MRHIFQTSDSSPATLQRNNAVRVRVSRGNEPQGKLFDHK